MAEPGVNERTTGDSAVNVLARCSMLLGSVTGFFLHMSTLGTKFLIISIWLFTDRKEPSDDGILFSALWSAIYTVMISITAWVLRKLIRTLFHNNSSNKDSLDSTLLHVEVRFAAGMLLSLGFSNILTEEIVGSTSSQTFQWMLLASAIPIVWGLALLTIYDRVRNKHEMRQSIESIGNKEENLLVI